MTVSTAAPLSAMKLATPGPQVPAIAVPPSARLRTPSPRQPTVDRQAVDRLLELDEAQLALLPLAALQGHRDDLRKLNASVASALTYALERREALTHEAEVLDGRIQVR